MKRNGLGVAVGAGEVRAVLVRRGVVQWHASEPFAGLGALATALRTLLARAPRLSIGTRVTVVISPAWVQVKSLSGLPSLKPARLASQLLRENQQAFFLWKGTSALIADIQRLKDGTAWGAAFDRDVIDELTRAFRVARIGVRCVAPAVVAIVAALPNRVTPWSDGDDWFELEGDRDGLRRVERIASNAPHVVTQRPAPLARLGDAAAGFLDAYAAAVAPRTLALAWRVQSDEARSRVLARVCNVGLAGVLTAATAFVAFGPGIRARSFGRAADRELARNRVVQIELAHNESELRRVTQMLNRIESFRADRGRVTRVLGELAQSIPESTAMLTFHVDSVEGAFTAIAPHVADVLPELESIREVAVPRIVGSVTREVLAGVHVERASFRFRRSRATRSAPKQVTR
jgi:Tfp pilus assembly protein PilN